MVAPRLKQCLATLALFGFASVANAVGNAIVVNHCDFPVYLWPVSNTQGAEITLSPGGGTYDEPFQTNPDGGGISLKISPENSISGPIIQFEYTLVDVLYYDISKVNGNPFGDHDLTLVPSISSCTGVFCRPNGQCAAGTVFYQPYENSAVEGCDPSTNLVFNLCSGNGGGGGSGHRHRKHRKPALAPQPAQTTPPAAPPPASPTTPPPAPAPTPTPAPAPAPAPAGGTTFVTQYVTYYTTVDSVVTITARGAKKYVHATAA